MRRLILYVLFYFIIMGLSAQYIDEIIPYRQGDKWGYSNEEGKLIIKPEFESAEMFQLATKPKYSFIGDKDTLLFAEVKKNGEVYCIDQSGKRIVVSQNYYVCELLFGCGDFGNKIKTADGIGFQFENGVVIPPSFTEIERISENLIMVRLKSGEYGILNQEGNWELPPIYEYLHLLTECYEGVLIYKSGEYFGIINIYDDLMTPPKYSGIWSFVGDIAPVRNKEGLLGYINRKGKEYFNE